LNTEPQSVTTINSLAVSKKTIVKIQGDGQEMAAKILIMAVQVNLRIWHQIHNYYYYEIFAIRLPSQPFLVTTLNFTSFPQWPS